MRNLSVCLSQESTVETSKAERHSSATVAVGDERAPTAGGLEDGERVVVERDCADLPDPGTVYMR